MKSLVVVSAIFLSLLVWPFVAETHGQSVAYTIVDLGPGQAMAVSSNGQAVGQARTASGFLHAVRWFKDGTRQDLGSLGSNSIAYGISPNGQYVVGTTDVSGTQHAVLWTSDMLQDIHTNVCGLATWFSCAKAVNSNGQITGWTRQGYDYCGFLYSNGVTTDLGTLPGMTQSQGWAINDSGCVVGISFSDYANWQQPRAFLWKDGVMQDLGALGNNESEAYGINDSDQIVGYSTAGNSQIGHVVLWLNGSIQDLGVIGVVSQGLAINKNGQIVGVFVHSLGGNTRALLYSDGSLWNLNDLIDPASGWTLVWANAINDSGQIVGWGINPSGQTHAFLLNPLPGFVFPPRLEIKPDRTLANHQGFTDW